ncbi:helix-turn-helix domain-containing protein [Desmospora activa]|uniref:helix-turn-helix domain-containing protein n=1 Tax=Desmospora activa TaxID=500615 RepID=UPI0014759486|nr:helix-turn-helix transcriptional regulator [Desmospora activa]
MGKIRVVLRDTLNELGMTQKELAQRTQIRESTISLLTRDAGSSVNKEILARVMDALEIDDIRKIIKYEPDEK